MDIDTSVNDPDNNKSDGSDVDSEGEVEQPPASHGRTSYPLYGYGQPAAVYPFYPYYMQPQMPYPIFPLRPEEQQPPKPSKKKVTEKSKEEAKEAVDESETHKVPRKKVAIACHCCRHKKIKCSGEKPACQACVNFNRDCTYEAEARTRGPAKKTKPFYPGIGSDSATVPKPPRTEYAEDNTSQQTTATNVGGSKRKKAS